MFSVKWCIMWGHFCDLPENWYIYGWDRKPLVALKEWRRLFERLWMDEDEDEDEDADKIELLCGFPIAYSNWGKEREGVFLHGWIWLSTEPNSHQPKARYIWLVFEICCRTTGVSYRRISMPKFRYEIGIAEDYRISNLKMKRKSGLRRWRCRSEKVPNLLN